MRFYPAVPSEETWWGEKPETGWMKRSLGSADGIYTKQTRYQGSPPEKGGLQGVLNLRKGEKK
jgi:hypothetical protein